MVWKDIEDMYRKDFTDIEMQRGCRVGRFCRYSTRQMTDNRLTNDLERILVVH